MSPAGIESSGLHASTFPAFGLEVIGRATSEKPRLAPWLDRGEDVKMGCSPRLPQDVSTANRTVTTGQLGELVTGPFRAKS